MKISVTFEGMSFEAVAAEMEKFLASANVNLGRAHLVGNPAADLPSETNRSVTEYTPEVEALDPPAPRKRGRPRKTETPNQDALPVTNAATPADYQSKAALHPVATPDLTSEMIETEEAHGRESDIDPEPAGASVSRADASAPTAPIYSKQDVLGRLQKVMDTVNVGEVRRILKLFGSERISELSPDFYPAVVAEVDSVLARKTV